ncbi:SDR family NAD(P)-dependent oxidoreductase [Halanaerobium sp. Z-7514]|uniref:SDR family NAD(P)-dependent oxidoreductase n=1 Tax=Halanaerobium polyolivorans TaxID=2886943 RepID=A0AAW4WTW3_9FIRM|nr:oxidoreductase [Halanaerobium polyolivorans]MCC3143960.1 SDR family NAD(P)-dependent oxidoreductase [Halanaerobium polyolivorans]RQD74656.1 MAG: SDR family NAD(P)-dependent oxidoreductase [Halanaerobium sp. MSAO_Bac5]
MNKEVVLITGASSGIGKITAEKLLKAGYIVYGVARSIDSLKYLAEYKYGHYKYLDLSETESIEKCVSEIIETENKIDILINNAGYGAFGAVEDFDISEARAEFEVNLFAAAKLIKEVLPFMRANKNGKIINISSVAGKVWFPFAAWYNASKFALEGLSDVLRNEVKEFGIDVVIIQPAAVKSNWVNGATESLLENSAESVYAENAKKTAKAFKNIYANNYLVIEAEVIANLILKAVKAKKAKARYRAPFYAKLLLFFRSRLPDRIFDYLTNKIMNFFANK